MNKHIHKIGIIFKPHVAYGCVDCMLRFGTIEALNYIERILGRKEGLKYWRALRAMLDNMRLQWKYGVRFEGTWTPVSYKK